MGVQTSAVARVIGIATSYQDMRGGSVVFLPQRVAVFAQGATGTTFATTKWESTGAGDAGTRFGLNSPIKAILDVLQPPDGSGVGSIPVTVYPMADAVGATAATGDITPSGTATSTKTYKARVGGLESLPFVIAAGAVNVTSACAAIGYAIANASKSLVNVTYTYGTVTTGNGTNTGNGTISLATVHSGSSPLPGAYSLTCNTSVANGGVWTIRDPNGTVISTSVTQTVGASQATAFSNIAGLDFTITDGSTDFAVNDSFTITVPATKVSVTSSWKGASANGLVIEIIGDSVGVTFAITQPTGGAGNPDVGSSAVTTSPLGQVGSVWETMLLNQMNIDDTTTLDKFSTWGESRWGELVHAPAVVFTGTNQSDRGLATVVPASRKTDRTNSQLVAPGSTTIPFLVAARQLVEIVTQANENPPINYCTDKAPGIIPGTAAQQWDYPNRDAAVKAGSSTVTVSDGVVQLEDIVTFYHPDGEDPPAYRYVVDIVRLQNVIFNYRLVAATPEWAKAAIIPDDQPTVNPDARHPKDLVTDLNAATQAMADWAVLANPSTIKKNTTCVIAGPKRINAVIPVQLSGNSNIISLDLKFGFNFGS